MRTGQDGGAEEEGLGEGDAEDGLGLALSDGDGVLEETDVPDHGWCRE